MFQEMQQIKDNEISSIKQMKRDVEMRLENVLDPDKGEFELSMHDTCNEFSYQQVVKTLIKM